MEQEHLTNGERNRDGETVPLDNRNGSAHQVESNLVGTSSTGIKNQNTTHENSNDEEEEPPSFEVCVYLFEEKNKTGFSCTTDSCSCDKDRKKRIVDEYVKALIMLIGGRQKMCPHTVHHTLRDKYFRQNNIQMMSWRELGEILCDFSGGNSEVTTDAGETRAPSCSGSSQTLVQDTVPTNIGNNELGPPPTSTSPREIQKMMSAAAMMIPSHMLDRGQYLDTYRNCNTRSATSNNTVDTETNHETANITLNSSNSTHSDSVTEVSTVPLLGDASNVNETPTLTLHEANDNRDSTPAPNKNLDITTDPTRNDNYDSEASIRIPDENADKASMNNHNDQSSTPDENSSNQHLTSGPTLDENYDTQATTPARDDSNENQISSPTQDNQASTLTQDENISSQASTPTRDENIDNETTSPTRDENNDKESSTPTRDENNDNETTNPTRDENKDNETTTPTRHETNDNETTTPTRDENNDKESSTPTRDENNDNETATPTQDENKGNDASCLTQEGISLSYEIVPFTQMESESETLKAAARSNDDDLSSTSTVEVAEHPTSLLDYSDTSCSVSIAYSTCSVKRPSSCASSETEIISSNEPRPDINILDEREFSGHILTFTLGESARVRGFIKRRPSTTSTGKPDENNSELRSESTEVHSQSVSCGPKTVQNENTQRQTHTVETNPPSEKDNESPKKCSNKNRKSSASLSETGVSYKRAKVAVSDKAVLQTQVEGKKNQDETDLANDNQGSIQEGQSNKADDTTEVASVATLASAKFDKRAASPQKQKDVTGTVKQANVNVSIPQDTGVTTRSRSNRPAPASVKKLRDNRMTEKRNYSDQLLSDATNSESDQSAPTPSIVGIGKRLRSSCATVETSSPSPVNASTSKRKRGQSENTRHTEVNDNGNATSYRFSTPTQKPSQSKNTKKDPPTVRRLEKNESPCHTNVHKQDAIANAAAPKDPTVEDSSEESDSDSSQKSYCSYASSIPYKNRLHKKKKLKEKCKKDRESRTRHKRPSIFLGSKKSSNKSHIGLGEEAMKKFEAIKKASENKESQPKPPEVDDVHMVEEMQRKTSKTSVSSSGSQTTICQPSKEKQTAGIHIPLASAIKANPMSMIRSTSSTSDPASIPISHSDKTTSQRASLTKSTSSPVASCSLSDSQELELNDDWGRREISPPTNAYQLSRGVLGSNQSATETVRQTSHQDAKLVSSPTKSGSVEIPALRNRISSSASETFKSSSRNLVSNDQNKPSTALTRSSSDALRNLREARKDLFDPKQDAIKIVPKPIPKVKDALQQQQQRNAQSSQNVKKPNDTCKNYVQSTTQPNGLSTPSSKEKSISLSSTSSTADIAQETSKSSPNPQPQSNKQKQNDESNDDDLIFIESNNTGQCRSGAHTQNVQKRKEHSKDEDVIVLLHDKDSSKVRATQDNQNIVQQPSKNNNDDDIHVLSSQKSGKDASQHSERPRVDNHSDKKSSTVNANTPVNDAQAYQKPASTAPKSLSFVDGEIRASTSGNKSSTEASASSSLSSGNWRRGRSSDSKEDTIDFETPPEGSEAQRQYQHGRNSNKFRGAEKFRGNRGRGGPYRGNSSFASRPYYNNNGSPHPSGPYRGPSRANTINTLTSHGRYRHPPHNQFQMDPPPPGLFPPPLMGRPPMFMPYTGMEGVPPPGYPPFPPPGFHHRPPY